MSGVYENPLGSFRYQVDFKEQMLSSATEGSEIKICSGAFSECTGLEATMEPKAIKEGGRNWGAAQRAGLVGFSTVILRRGLTQSQDLWAWFNLVGEGAFAQRLNVTITVFDQSGKGILSWTLLKAMPIKFKAPDLNATNNEIAIEELHLVHEGLGRSAPVVKQL